MDFRCSTSSVGDGESIVGTAPTDTDWLFVEYAGPWGRKAVAESRLPDEVRAHLGSLPGVRVQLIRRHGGVEGPGVRVFTATLGAADGEVRSTRLDDVRELPDLDLATLRPHAEPLWLVCTNGRRDVCCAEVGRPVAAALAARWPEATWETTHLGGHRFSGTLLALPGGLTLGRLDAASAVTACAAIEAGDVPLELVRGRAGLPGVAQAAELHVRSTAPGAASGEVRVVEVRGAEVVVRAAGRDVVVRVEESTGPPRRQSCADLKEKPAPVYRVLPA